MSANEVLAEALDAIGVEAPDDAAELELTSLQVVTLVEYLERELGIAFGGKDVTRENFATKRSLAALLARKGAT